MTVLNPIALNPKSMKVEIKRLKKQIAERNSVLREAEFVLNNIKRVCAENAAMIRAAWPSQFTGVPDEKVYVMAYSVIFAGTQAKLELDNVFKTVKLVKAEKLAKAKKASNRKC